MWNIFKLRHCAIFPRDDSLSIFAATTFHNHVRNGMAWYHCAINTEIEIIDSNLNLEIKLEIKFFLRVRLISTSWLNLLLNLHRMPIKRIIYPQPRSTHLEVSFPLRCLQRLSLLYIATQRLPMAR